MKKNYLVRLVSLILVALMLSLSLFACISESDKKITSTTTNTNDDSNKDEPVKKEFRIHTDFVGGNMKIRKQEGDHYYINNEQRDTTSEWFYWAFCVEGAEGKTLTFQFDSDHRLGYYGPAISYDLENWTWLGSESMPQYGTFTYTFEEGEDTVYFAHSMLYHPERFFDFAEENSLEIKELCKTKEGSSVPYITIGEGSQKIVITARHHACESTGSYVFEGLIEELLKTGVPEGTQVIAIPFVDYDGVINGDQGKNRDPHDHNRDYRPGEESIYPEVAAIKRILDEEDILYAFDLHAPGHWHRANDTVYGTYSAGETQARSEIFWGVLENNISEDSLKFSMSYTKQYASDPTTAIVSFRRYAEYIGAELSLCLETTYFGLSGNTFTERKGLELGRCFARAILDYHNNK